MKDSTRPIEGIEAGAKDCTIVTDTSAKTQRDLIMSTLNKHGSATTIDFRAMGIMSPAPRIMELKKAGFDIVATLEYSYDHAGVKHSRVARYWLKGEAAHECL